MNVNLHRFSRELPKLIPSPLQVFGDVAVNRKVPPVKRSSRSWSSGQYRKILRFILAGRDPFFDRSIGFPRSSFETACDKFFSHKYLPKKKTGAVSVRENHRQSGGLLNLQDIHKSFGSAFIDRTTLG